MFPSSSKVKGHEEILELRNKISAFRIELYDLEKIYNEKLLIFQKQCGKKGHDYVAEKDDDYHNTRYYYVCKHCDFFTRYK